MSSRSPIHILPDAVIPTTEVGDDGNGTVRHGDGSPPSVTAGSSARHGFATLDATHASVRKPELPLINRDSGSPPALPANDAIPPVPSTVCGACGGSGTRQHPFPGCCSTCAGTGYRLIICEKCEGDGQPHADQDDDGGSCDTCQGRGVKGCIEPRCNDDATHVFRERGQNYDLCRAHYLEWCECAEVTP